MLFPALLQRSVFELLLLFARLDKLSRTDKQKYRGKALPALFVELSLKTGLRISGQWRQRKHGVADTAHARKSA